MTASARGRRRRRHSIIFRRPAAAIDMDLDAAREHHVEPFLRLSLSSRHVTGLKRARSMPCADQPAELGGRRSADALDAA